MKKSYPEETTGDEEKKRRGTRLFFEERANRIHLPGCGQFAIELPF